VVAALDLEKHGDDWPYMGQAAKALSLSTCTWIGARKAEEKKEKGGLPEREH
jgi:hypothetical protein